MKKIEYQTPEVKVKALFSEQLLQGSVTGTGGAEIGYGGEDDGTHDPSSKTNIQTHSVWED